MLLIGTVCVIAVFAIAALFYFAYRMDKWAGVIGVVVFGVWVWFMQPAHANEQPTDASWPSIDQGPMMPLLVGYNVFGDKIVLFRQFCAGDASKSEHMHMYGIYSHNGAFIQGGCWQFDLAETHKTRRIKYFDMGGAGWDSWPVNAFHVARSTIN